MMIDSELTKLAEGLGEQLKQRKFTLALAESCTGGLCAEVITRVAGSSAWFEYGLVTYSNKSKQKLLHVSAQALNSHGAVSEEVAKEMALGVLSVSCANLSASVTGVAGPAGGSEAKPVGTVWFAWALAGGELIASKHQFKGNRQEIRHQSAKVLIEGLIKLASAVD